MRDLFQSRSQALRSQALASLLLAAVCVVPAAAAPEDVPGRALAARVEAELVRRPDAFANDPAHQALVSPVPQPVLLEFMRQIRVFGAAGDLVLGTAHGLETHGAGLLSTASTSPRERASTCGCRRRNSATSWARRGKR